MPIYDLERRTYEFAKKVALYCKKLPKNGANIEYSTQGTRSSGSIGANYIEANESLGKKDFIMRVRIARKEAKETVYWLGLIVETNPEEYSEQGLALQNEAIELKKILSSILDKSSKP